MANKRPSYRSIRARQRNIIEGLGTTDLRYKEAAKKFNVTPRELQHFVESKPRTLRKNFNRSPVYAKLYNEGARPIVRERLGIKRITHFKFRPTQIRQYTVTSGLSEYESNRRQQVGQMIRALYVTRFDPKTAWAAWTREHNLPQSIKVIRLLHRNNKITDGIYAEALVEWQDIYPGIGDDTWASYVVELPSDYTF